MPKCDWTLEEARAWIDEHKDIQGLEHKPKENSQSEIKDEFDYVHALVIADDLNDENRQMLYEIVRETLRISGADIPVDILTRS